MLVAISFWISGFSQFISGDCCTCSAYFYGSSEGFFRDSTINLSYIRADNDWMENSFVKYSYTNGRLCETVGYNYDKELFRRHESYMQIKNYDPDMKLIERLHFRWNKVFQEWTENSRFTSYHNDKRQHTHSINEKFNVELNNWEKSTRNETIKDSKNNSHITLTRNWDPSFEKWIISSKNTCTDDIEKLTRMCYSSVLDKESASWKMIQKSVYLYNENMLLKEMTAYSMDKETNEWINPRQSSYEYDEAGRKTKWYSWSLDKETGERKGSGHQHYIYDRLGNNTEVHRYSWDKAQGEWIIYQKQINYWSQAQVMAGIETQVGGSLTVYPNPFTDQAIANLSGITNIKMIELIDINSRLIRKYTDINSTELIIERADLKPGIYFLKVYSDKIFTGRLIIR